MEIPKVFESEYRFCEIIWTTEPIKSSKLAKICKLKLGWSKSTTYTVIKRLSERGIIVNDDTYIKSCYTKEEVQVSEIRELLEKKFDGSLPSFIAAFTNNIELSDKDKEEIKKFLE